MKIDEKDKKVASLLINLLIKICLPLSIKIFFLCISLNLGLGIM